MASPAAARAEKRHQRRLLLSASAGDIEQQEVLRKSYLRERDRHRAASPARTHSSAYFASAPHPQQRVPNKGRSPLGEEVYAHRSHIPRSLSASAASALPSAAAAARKERYGSRLAPPDASLLERSSAPRHLSSRHNNGERKPSSGRGRTFDFLDYRKLHSAAGSSSSRRVHDGEPRPYHNNFSSRTAVATSEGRDRSGTTQRLTQNGAGGRERRCTSPRSSGLSPRLKDYFHRHSLKAAKEQDYSRDAEAEAGRRGSCVSEYRIHKRSSTNRQGSSRGGSRSRAGNNRNSRHGSIRRSGSDCKRGSPTRYGSISNSTRWSGRRYGSGSRRGSTAGHSRRRQESKYGISSSTYGSRRSSYKQSPVRTENFTHRQFSKCTEPAEPKVEDRAAAARAAAEGAASEGAAILFVGGGRSGGTHRDTVLPTVAVKTSSTERAAPRSHVSADAPPSPAKRRWRNSFGSLRRGSSTARDKKSPSRAGAPLSPSKKYSSAGARADAAAHLEHRRRSSAAPSNYSRAYSPSKRGTEALTGDPPNPAALLEAAAAFLRQQPSQQEEPQRKNRWTPSRSSSPSWKKQPADRTASPRRVGSSGGPPAKTSEKSQAKQSSRSESTSPRSRCGACPRKTHSPFSFLFRKPKELPPLCVISAGNDSCSRQHQKQDCNTCSLSPAQERRLPSRHSLIRNDAARLPGTATHLGVISTTIPGAAGGSTLPHFCRHANVARDCSSSRSHRTLPSCRQETFDAPCFSLHKGRTVEKQQDYNSSQKIFCSTASRDIPRPVLPCSTAAGSSCSWRHQAPLRTQGTSSISFSNLPDSRLLYCPVTGHLPDGTALTDSREHMLLPPRLSLSRGSSSLCDSVPQQHQPQENPHLHECSQLDLPFTEGCGLIDAGPFPLSERCRSPPLGPAVSAAESRKSAAAVAAAFATSSARPTLSSSSSWCVSSSGEKCEHDVPYLARPFIPPPSPSRYGRDCCLKATTKYYDVALRNQGMLKKGGQAMHRDLLLGNSRTAAHLESAKEMIPPHSILQQSSALPNRTQLGADIALAGAPVQKSKSDSFHYYCGSSSHCPSAAVTKCTGKHVGHPLRPGHRIDASCAAVGEFPTDSGDAGPLTTKSSRDGSRAAFFQAIAAAEHSVAAASCAASDTQRSLRCERAAATAAAAASARRQRLLQQQEEEHERRFHLSNSNFSSGSTHTTVPSGSCFVANAAATATSQQRTLQKLRSGPATLLRSLSADPAVRRNAVPFSHTRHSSRREDGREQPWLSQQRLQHSASDCYAVRHLHDSIWGARPQASSEACAAEAEPGPPGGRCQRWPRDSERVFPAATTLNNDLSSLLTGDSAFPEERDALESNHRYPWPKPAAARRFRSSHSSSCLTGNSSGRWCFAAPSCAGVSAGDADLDMRNLLERNTSCQADIANRDRAAWRSADIPAAGRHLRLSPFFSTSRACHAPVAAELTADIAEKNMQERLQQIARQEHSEQWDSISTCGENDNSCTRRGWKNIAAPSMRLLHSLTSLSPLSLKRRGSLDTATSVARKAVAGVRSGSLNSNSTVEYDERLGRNDAFLCGSFPGDTSSLVVPREQSDVLPSAATCTSRSIQGVRQDYYCSGKPNEHRSYCCQEDVKTTEKAREIYCLMDRLKGVHLPISKENTSTMRLHLLKHHPQVGSPTMYALSTKSCITDAATAHIESEKMKDRGLFLNRRKSHATVTSAPVKSADTQTHPGDAASPEERAEEQTGFAGELNTRIQRQPGAVASEEAYIVSTSKENCGRAVETSVPDAAATELVQRKNELTPEITAVHDRRGDINSVEEFASAAHDSVGASVAAIVFPGVRDSDETAESVSQPSARAATREAGAAGETATSVVLTAREFPVGSSVMADFASAYRRLTTEDMHEYELVKREPAAALFPVSESCMRPAAPVTDTAAKVVAGDISNTIDSAGSAVAAVRSNDRSAFEVTELDQCRRRCQWRRFLCGVSMGVRETATARTSSFPAKKGAETLLARVAVNALQRQRAVPKERQTRLRQLLEQQQRAQLRWRTQQPRWDVKERQEVRGNKQEEQRQDQRPKNIYNLQHLVQHLRNFQTVLRRNGPQASATRMTAGPSPLQIDERDDLNCIHLLRELLQLSPTALESRVRLLQQSCFANCELSRQLRHVETQMQQHLGTHSSVYPQQSELRPYRAEQRKTTRRRKLEKQKSPLQQCTHEQLVQLRLARILQQRLVKRQWLLHIRVLRKKQLVSALRLVHETVQKQKQEEETRVIGAVVLQQGNTGSFCVMAGVNRTQQQERKRPAESAPDGQPEESELKSGSEVQQQKIDVNSKRDEREQQEWEKQTDHLLVCQQKQHHRRKGETSGFSLPDCLHHSHCVEGASPVKALKKSRPPSAGQRLVLVRPPLATNYTSATPTCTNPAEVGSTSAAAAPSSVKYPSTSSSLPSSSSSFSSFPSSFSSSSGAFPSSAPSSASPTVEAVGSTSSLTAPAAGAAAAASVSPCPSFAAAAPPASAKGPPHLQLSLFAAHNTKATPAATAARQAAAQAREAATTGEAATTAAATAAGAKHSNNTDFAAAATNVTPDIAAGCFNKEQVLLFPAGLTPRNVAVTPASTSHIRTVNAAGAAGPPEWFSRKTQTPAATAELPKSTESPEFSIVGPGAPAEAPAAHTGPSPSKKITSDTAANGAASSFKASAATMAGSATCSTELPATVRWPVTAVSRHVDLVPNAVASDKKANETAGLALLAMPSVAVDNTVVVQEVKMPAALVSTLPSKNKEPAPVHCPAYTACAADVSLAEMLHSAAAAACPKIERAPVAGPRTSLTTTATSSSSALSFNSGAASADTSIAADRIGTTPAAAGVPSLLSGSQSYPHSSGARKPLIAAAEASSTICGRGPPPENLGCSPMPAQTKQQLPQQVTSTSLDSVSSADVTEKIPFHPDAHLLLIRDVTVEKADIRPAQHLQALGAGARASTVFRARADMLISAAGAKESNRRTVTESSPASSARMSLCETSHGRGRPWKQHSRCQDQHARAQLICTQGLGKEALYSQQQECAGYSHAMNGRGSRSNGRSDSQNSCGCSSSAHSCSANSMSRSQRSNTNTSSSEGECTSRSSKTECTDSSDEVQGISRISSRSCNRCLNAQGEQRSEEGISSTKIRHRYQDSPSEILNKRGKAHHSHSENTTAIRRQCRDITYRDKRPKRRRDNSTSDGSYGSCHRSSIHDTQGSRIEQCKQPHRISSCTRSTAILHRKGCTIKDARWKIPPEKSGGQASFTRRQAQASAADSVLDDCNTIGNAERTVFQRQPLSSSDGIYAVGAPGSRKYHQSETPGATQDTKEDLSVREKTNESNFTSKTRDRVDRVTAPRAVAGSTGVEHQCSSLQSAVAAAAAATASVGDVLRAIQEMRSDSFRLHHDVIERRRKKSSRSFSRTSSSKTSRSEHSTNTACSKSSRRPSSINTWSSSDEEFTNRHRRDSRNSMRRNSKDGRRRKDERKNESDKRQAPQFVSSFNLTESRRQETQYQQQRQQPPRRGFPFFAKNKEEIELEEQEEQLFVTNAEDLWLLQQTNGETVGQLERLFALAAAEEEGDNGRSPCAVTQREETLVSIGTAPLHATYCGSSQRTCCCCLHQEQLSPAATAPGGSSAAKFFLPAPSCDYPAPGSSAPPCSAADMGATASFSSAVTFIDINVHSSRLVGGASSSCVKAAVQAPTERVLLLEDAAYQLRDEAELQRQQATQPQPAVETEQQQNNPQAQEVSTQRYYTQQQQDRKCREQLDDSKKTWSTDDPEQQASTHRCTMSESHTMHRSQAQQDPESVCQAEQDHPEEIKGPRFLNAQRGQQRQWIKKQHPCVSQENEDNQEQHPPSGGIKHQHQEIVQHTECADAQQEHQQPGLQKHELCLEQKEENHQQPTLRGHSYKHRSSKGLLLQDTAEIVMECGPAAATGQPQPTLPQQQERVTRIEAPSSPQQRMEQQCKQWSYEKRTQQQMASTQGQLLEEDTAEVQQPAATATEATEVQEVASRIQVYNSSMCKEKRVIQEHPFASKSEAECGRTSKKKRGAPRSSTSWNAAGKHDPTWRSVSTRSLCIQCNLSDASAVARIVAAASPITSTCCDTETQYQQKAKYTKDQQQCELQQWKLSRQEQQNQWGESLQQEQRDASLMQEKRVKEDQLVLPTRKKCQQPDSHTHLARQQAAPLQSHNAVHTQTERDQVERACTSLCTTPEKVVPSTKPVATQTTTRETSASEPRPEETEELSAFLTPVLPSAASPDMKELSENDVASASAVVSRDTNDVSPAAGTHQKDRQQPEQQKKLSPGGSLVSPLILLGGSPTESEFTFASPEPQELQAGGVVATPKEQEPALSAEAPPVASSSPARCELVSPTTSIYEPAGRDAPVPTSTEPRRTATAPRLTAGSVCSLARKDAAAMISAATKHETAAVSAVYSGGSERPTSLEAQSTITARASSPPALLPQEDEFDRSTPFIAAKSSTSSLQYSSSCEQGTHRQCPSSSLSQKSVDGTAPHEDRQESTSIHTEAVLRPRRLTPATVRPHAAALVHISPHATDSVAPRKPPVRPVTAAATYGRIVAKEDLHEDAQEALVEIQVGEMVKSATNLTATTERLAEVKLTTKRTPQTLRIMTEEVPIVATCRVPAFIEIVLSESNLCISSNSKTCRRRQPSSSIQKKTDSAAGQPGFRGGTSSSERKEPCLNHRTEMMLQSTSLSSNEGGTSSASGQRGRKDVHSSRRNIPVSSRSREESTTGSSYKQGDRSGGIRGHGPSSANLCCIDTADTGRATDIPQQKACCPRFDEPASAHPRHLSQRERRELTRGSAAHADIKGIRRSGAIQERQLTVAAASRAHAENVEEPYAAIPNKYNSTERIYYTQPSPRNDATARIFISARLPQKTPRMGAGECARLRTNISHTGASNSNISNSSSRNGGRIGPGSSKSRTSRDQTISEDKSIRHVLATWRRCPLRSRMVRFCSGGCAWDTAAATTRTPLDVPSTKVTSTLHRRHRTRMNPPVDSSDSVAGCQCPSRACSIQTEDSRHMPLTNITALFPDMRIKEIYTAMPQRPAAAAAKKTRLCKATDAFLAFSSRNIGAGTNSPQRSGSLTRSVSVSSRNLLGPRTYHDNTQKASSDKKKYRPRYPHHRGFKGNSNRDNSNNSKSSGCGSSTRDSLYTDERDSPSEAYCHRCPTGDIQVNRGSCRKSSNRRANCSGTRRYRCNRRNGCGHKARVSRNSEQRPDSCEHISHCCSSGSRTSSSSRSESRRIAQETERDGQDTLVSCSPSYFTDKGTRVSTPKAKAASGSRAVTMPLEECTGHMTASSGSQQDQRYTSISRGRVDSSGRRIRRPPLSATDTLRGMFCPPRGESEQPLLVVRQRQGRQQPLLQETDSSTQSPCQKVGQASPHSQGYRLLQQLPKPHQVLEEFPSLSLQLGDSGQQQQRCLQVLPQQLHPNGQMPTVTLQHRPQQPPQCQQEEQHHHPAQHMKRSTQPPTQGQQQRPSQQQATLELQQNQQQTRELQQHHRQPSHGKQTQQQRSPLRSTQQEGQQHLLQMKEYQPQPTPQQHHPYCQQRQPPQQLLQQEQHRRRQRLQLLHSVQHPPYQKQPQVPLQQPLQHDQYPQQQQAQQQQPVQQHLHQPLPARLEQRQQQHLLQQCRQRPSDGKVDRPEPPQQHPVLQQYRQQSTQLEPRPQQPAPHLAQHHKQRPMQQHQRPQQPAQQHQFHHPPVQKQPYKEQQQPHHRRDSSSPPLAARKECRAVDNASSDMEHGVSTQAPSQGHFELRPCLKLRANEGSTPAAVCAANAAGASAPFRRERLQGLLVQSPLRQAGGHTGTLTAAVTSSEPNLPSSALASTPASPIPRQGTSRIPFAGDAAVGPPCMLRDTSGEYCVAAATTNAFLSLTEVYAVSVAVSDCARAESASRVAAGADVGIASPGGAAGHDGRDVQFENSKRTLNNVSINSGADADNSQPVRRRSVHAAKDKKWPPHAQPVPFEMRLRSYSALPAELQSPPQKQHNQLPPAHELSLMRMLQRQQQITQMRLENPGLVRLLGAWPVPQQHKAVPPFCHRRTPSSAAVNCITSGVNHPRSSSTQHMRYARQLDLPVQIAASAISRTARYIAAATNPGQGTPTPA